MSTTSAPQQSDGKAWRADRRGRFTASEVGCLFAEPKTLTAQHIADYGFLVTDIARDHKSFNSTLRKRIEEKGYVLFGDTAMKYIASKAGERATGAEDDRITTRSMDRGTVLEPVAKTLISEHWKPISDCSIQLYKHHGAATPDGLVDAGKSTVDIKCPERSADLILFDMEVKDDDFDSLEAWDRNYAYQVAMQIKCAGAESGWLIYFTDRFPVYPLTDEELSVCNNIITYGANKLAEERGWGTNYTFASNGYWYVAKRLTLTPELSARIDRVLDAADAECNRLAARIPKPPKP